MKKPLKIFVLIILAGVIGGFVYWQYNKRKIIKDTITDAIAQKSDSLYFLRYDSSSIDEINGNVAFYNVVLQSDSAQKKLLSSTDSLPNALYNIRVSKVAASGIDMAGLLKQSNVAAKKILLTKPVIQIINTGADRPRPFTMNDTLELYQKILGKFRSIKADTIQIVNGTLLMTNKAGEPQATFENINVTLNSFLIDRTKNYESIISYFIKDVHATVENVQLPESKTGTRINIEKFDYDAAKRTLHVAAVKQYRKNDMNPIIDLQNIHISNLNTDAFIMQQRLKAGSITCDGGLITIYKSPKAGKANSGDKSIDLSSDLIDQAQVEGINLGNTKIIILDKNDPKATPFILDNAKFEVLTPVKLYEGTTVNNLVNNAQWQLSADGFSFESKDGLYKIAMGSFVVNNVSSTASITNFSVKPLISEQQFVKRSKYSSDQYNLTINNIRLSGINIKKLLASREIEVETASLQPIIKIYNDKTLPGDQIDKTGKYPHQSLLKLDMPVYIKTVKVTNGTLSYRERGEKSAMVGNVLFSGIEGTLSNITNVPARIKSNPLLTLAATAKFLNEGRLSTKWQFPLNTMNGNFRIAGQLQGMNAVSLNPIIEPLAMASVKAGKVDKVTFDINGSNKGAKADVLFLYRDLKLDILKKDDDEKDLKKKGLFSWLANTIIKNENTSSANVKDVVYDRDVTRSFFNLVWKTIFTGVKSTAIGKREDKKSSK